MRDRGLVRTGVELAVLVARLDERRLAALDRLGHHVTLALLKVGCSLALVLAILGHNLLELLLLIMHIIDRIAIRWDQKPLVHINNVNIKGTILLP